MTAPAPPATRSPKAWVAPAGSGSRLLGCAGARFRRPGPGDTSLRGAPRWARPPGRRIRFTAARATASHLSLGEVVLVALAVALVAVLLPPPQFAMMNAAQG